MKKIRRISENPIAIILVLMNFIFVSCNRDILYSENTPSENSAGLEKNNITKRTAEISGKEMFNEIIFGQTNFLDLDHVKEINSALVMTNEEKAKYNNIINMIDEKINEQDPYYFDNFKNSLSSTDHYEISETIEGMNDVLEKAILSIPELQQQYLIGMKIAKSTDIQQFKNEDGSINKDAVDNYLKQEYGNDYDRKLNASTFLAVAVFVAIAVDAALALNVAVAVFCYTWVKNNCKNSVSVNKLNSSLLKNEILVQQIYEKFH